jgi:predicted nucleic acid-binding protein
VDTSVLLKWFDAAGEDEVPSAQALRSGHLDGATTVRILDLAIYELSNVLIRRRRWAAEEAAAQLDDLLLFVGRPVALDRSWLRDALGLAEQHGLSGYDAHWAAAARHLGVPLVSADRRLLDTGLAESPTAVATRLGLLQ